MHDALLVPLLLGIAYAAAPGVVNTECLRNGVVSGFRPAFLVQTGALAGDAVWAVLAFSGLAALSRASSLLDVLGLLGGIYLCRLAFVAIRDAARGRAPERDGAGSHPLRTGLVFGLANPAALAFWSGVGGGVLATRQESGILVLAWFLLAFLGGALIWSIAFSTLASAGRRIARPWVFRVIGGLCGTIIGYFGVRLVWTSARRLSRVV